MKNNNIIPFISIIQSYSEIGVSYDRYINNTVWESWFNLLNSSLKPEGIMLKKYSDYRVVFYICASSTLSSLLIKGPAKSQKYKTIEYFLWIPYAPVVSDPNPLKRLTEYFKEGVAEVLNKLEYSEESIQKVLEKIK